MKPRSPRKDKELDVLDEMIEEITVDAYGDDEILWAFRQAFEDNVELPADGFVIGEPVSVIMIDYDGNERVGLTARCRREDSSEHIVAVNEVLLPKASPGAWHIAAYRKWLNLDPFPWEATLMMYCRGATSTTARFCAACTAMVCVSGVLGALTRQHASLIGCSG